MEPRGSKVRWPGRARLHWMPARSVSCLDSFHVTPQHVCPEAPSSLPEHLFPLPLPPESQPSPPRHSLQARWRLLACADLSPTALLLSPSNPMCSQSVSWLLMRPPRTGPLKPEGAPRGRVGDQQPGDPSQTLLAGSQPWPWGLSTEVSASSPPPPLPPVDVPGVLCR